MLVVHPYDFSLAVQAQRRTLKLTQAELAAKVGVGRQWIIDLEGGKEAVAFAPVVRTLAALGFELNLRSPERPPAWTVPLAEAARAREAALAGPQTARTGRPPAPSRRLAKRRPPASWLDG